MKNYLYALFLAIIFLSVHLLAIKFSWYALFAGNFDVIMHIIGGFTIGMFIYALVVSFKPDLVHKKCFIIGTVFLVGLIWEIFEAYYDIAGYPVGTKLYFIDTAKDLIDDIIGAGLLGILVSSEFFKHSKNK